MAGVQTLRELNRFDDGVQARGINSAAARVDFLRGHHAGRAVWIGGRRAPCKHKIDNSFVTLNVKSLTVKQEEADGDQKRVHHPAEGFQTTGKDRLTLCAVALIE